MSHDEKACVNCGEDRSGEATSGPVDDPYGYRAAQASKHDVGPVDDPYGYRAAARRPSDATPTGEKRGIDRESYTVRRFVLDHCAALGAEYEEDFRKDLLRMLDGERDACARVAEACAPAGLSDVWTAAQRAIASRIRERKGGA
jgi:hypothetical protein